jgi:hypothetical protein
LKAILVIAVLSLTLIACSSVSVTSDYNPEQDFSTYKSFAVYKNAIKDSQLEAAPLAKARVISAIEKVMTAKGFTMDESGNADVIIYPFAGAKEKMNVTDWGYGYGGYWGGYPYGRNVDVSYYTEASLILDMVDNKKDELAWRGIGTGVLHADRTPEERQAAIDEAVQKILDQYPPGSME